MSVPAVRRIVVGVDGSAESAAAVRWACREAGLRGAEVHAVHVQEAPRTASYALPAQDGSPHGGDVDRLWKSVMPDREPGGPEVRVRTEVAAGLAARVLLQRCDGADMLVLGTASDERGERGERDGRGGRAGRGASRPAGPVIRACLRRAPCPVVVISEEQDPLRGRDAPEAAASRALGVIPVPAPA